MKIRHILITQLNPDPAPYQILEKKYKVKVDFRPFIEIKPIPLKKFKKQRINPTEYSGIIFTSKNAVDCYFNLLKQLNLVMPPMTKYFCVNEMTAKYVQKYILLRKRKVCIGTGGTKELIDLIQKHPEEKYLYPCSEIRMGDIPKFLAENNFRFSEAVMYQTHHADLKGLNIKQYQLVAFFSPSGVESFVDNFPRIKNNTMLFASYGVTTATALNEHGFKETVHAPQPNAPSMSMAINLYLQGKN